MAAGEETFVVPTRMPKYTHTFTWPSESVFFRSYLFMYDDIRSMLSDEYPFMRDTMLIATQKYIDSKDVAAITCTSSSLGNTLAVWEYVNKHDDVITGAIFKAPQKVTKATKSKLSKEAIDDATKTKHSDAIPAAGRADHPSATVPKVPQQIVVWGQALSDGSVTSWGTDMSVMLNAMSQAGARVPILVLTKGAYGRFVGETVSANWNACSSMAMWGFMRSARQEIPNIPMLTMDVPYGMPTAQIGRTLMPSDAEQIYYHGVKFVPQVEAIDSLVKRAQNSASLKAGGTSGKPMFSRKMFNWGRPENKMDNVWFRQKFVAVGPDRMDMPSRGRNVVAT